MILKNCRYLITQNKYRQIHERIDVKIEGKCIIKIERDLEGKEIIDCSNKIVMPGLINCHTHLAMHSLKGICDDKELPEWLETIKKAENSLTKKEVYENVLLGVKEAIRFGTTTTFDSFRLHPEYCIKALNVSDIRFVFGSSKNSEIVIKQTGNLMTPGICTHSIYQHDEEEIKKSVRLAKEYKLLNRIHLAETRKERFDSKLTKDLLPLQYLENLGFLDENAVLIHAIWLTKGELDIIAKHNSKVVHCPVSNMKLASGGTIPLMEMWDRNIIVGLGTDSVASNNNLDLFEEMKLTGLLHKYHKWDPTAANVQKILDMATIEGAKVLGMEKNIGSIEIGKKADIIMLEITDKLLPINNLISNIIYCANGNDVTDVIIDGIKKV